MVAVPQQKKEEMKAKVEEQAAKVCMYGRVSVYVYLEIGACRWWVGRLVLVYVVGAERAGGGTLCWVCVCLWYWMDGWMGSAAAAAVDGATGRRRLDGRWSCVWCATQVYRRRWSDRTPTPALIWTRPPIYISVHFHTRAQPVYLHLPPLNIHTHP